MPEDAGKKKAVEKKDGGCYTGCVGVYRDPLSRSPVPKGGIIAELIGKLHEKGGVYRDMPAEKPEPEAKPRAVYNDGVVTVSADAEGRIVCPRLFFKPREEGKENEDDTVDLGVCRNCPEKRWRGYGTNGRRVVVTAAQRTAEEAVLTVDCNYPFDEPEMLEAYQMIMTVLSDVPLEKARPEKKAEKKDDMDLSEVDELLEGYKAMD